MLAPQARIFPFAQSPPWHSLSPTECIRGLKKIMAKEWEKFQSEFKKLKPSIDKHSAEAASAAYKRVTLASANVSEGESNLAESTVTARKNGVKGTALPDFMKDKTFADAKKLLDISVGQFVEELKTLDTFCDGAQATADKLATLYRAIEKDLKSRKDKSESKKDIEALQATCLKEHGELEKAAGFKTKPNKFMRAYVGNYMKTIKDILETAPEAQASKKEQTELPQLFVDRNIKLNTTKALAFGKKVKEACDLAMEAAANDLKDALPHLKTAQAALVQLKKLSDDYTEAEKKFADALTNSKDQGKIEKMLESIHKALDSAARTFKGVSTTIKKAG